MSQPAIKTFNPTGPCNPNTRYMLPVLARQTGVDSAIEEKNYFVLHAPQRSGKTTFLNFLTNKINSEGNYYALMCSLASLKIVSDKDETLTKIVSLINKSMAKSKVKQIKDKANTYNSLPQMADTNQKVRALLNQLCEDLDKDLIVFFEEADYPCWIGLLTFMAQIQEAYLIRERPGHKFPRAMAFVGCRDIMACLFEAQSDTKISKIKFPPFNIIKKTLTLDNFTKPEIKTLCQQHTTASGQIFLDSAIERIWHWSAGQPGSVNALANETVVKILNKDYSATITGEQVDQAAESLIKQRYAPFDSILKRLKEPRVHMVMDSVIAGIPFKEFIEMDNREYCQALGLLVPGESGKNRPANPLLQQVIPLVLTDKLVDRMPFYLANTAWNDGKIFFVNEILQSFQDFWKNNSKSFLKLPKQVDSDLFENYSDEEMASIIRSVVDSLFDEAFYSLTLLAYLRKLLDSSALIRLQYAEDRGSMDIVITYQERVYTLRVSIRRRVEAENDLDQLAADLSANGQKEGWFFVFDSDKNKTMDEKIFSAVLDHKNVIINIFVC
ncbi:MAG: hypothetical protein LBT38_10040 [Deltaproteobacteria bacterium]|jgi:hypothetical protein|nr:hypothetical protein [Deltaproteobacteria bacterium]